jgi:hypothetical protein
MILNAEQLSKRNAPSSTRGVFICALFNVAAFRSEKHTDQPPLDQP